MIDPNKKLKIPVKELQFIKPDVRQKAFAEIYQTYQNKYGIKLVFAYLNTDPSVIIDYIVMYKAKDRTGTTDIIMYDAVPACSDRSTPGYIYCKRNNKVDDFYTEGINSMTILSLENFNQFIELGLQLSRDKSSELYWKSPNNFKEVALGLLDMAFQYKKK